MTFWLIVLWVAGAVVLLCGLVLVIVVSVQAARDRQERHRQSEAFGEALRNGRSGRWLSDDE